MPPPCQPQQRTAHQSSQTTLSTSTQYTADPLALPATSGQSSSSTALNEVAIGAVTLVLALFAACAFLVVAWRIGTWRRRLRATTTEAASAPMPLPKLPQLPSPSASPSSIMKHVRKVSSAISITHLPDLKLSLRRSVEALTRTTSRQNAEHDDTVSIRSSTSSFAAPYIFDGDTMRPPRIFSLQGRTWHDVEREAQEFVQEQPIRSHHREQFVYSHRADMPRVSISSFAPHSIHAGLQDSEEWLPSPRRERFAYHDVERASIGSSLVPHSVSGSSTPLLAQPSYETYDSPGAPLNKALR